MTILALYMGQYHAAVANRYAIPMSGKPLKQATARARGTTSPGELPQPHQKRKTWRNWTDTGGRPRTYDRLCQKDRWWR